MASPFPPVQKLTPDMMIPIELLGEQWVLFRNEHGQPCCVKDECAHRGCPLSKGRVVDGQVECPYHGWVFNGGGTCTKMPSTVHCNNVAVITLPCAEKDGFIWVWPGDHMPTQVSGCVGSYACWLSSAHSTTLKPEVSCPPPPHIHTCHYVPPPPTHTHTLSSLSCPDPPST